VAVSQTLRRSSARAFVVRFALSACGVGLRGW
jgi:hypothetical protein